MQTQAKSGDLCRFLPAALAVRIVEWHVSAGIPVADFLDWRPADLSNICLDTGATLAEVLAARDYLAKAGA